MRYPTLNYIESSREAVEVFKGLNKNLRIEDGEFADMENLCSDRFPVMTPRDKRKMLPFKNTVGFVFMNNYLWREVRDEDDSGKHYLYRNDEKVMEIDMTVPSGQRRIIYFGSYILLGNGQYVNTEAFSDTGSIAVSNECTGTITYTLCKVDGSEYGSYKTSDTAPSSPSNGDYWIDTSGDIAVLKQYSSTASMWVTIATTYVKVSCAGIGKGLSKHDGVEISTDGAQEWLDGTQVLWDVGDDYLVVTGIIDSTITSKDANISVKREMPDVSYWFECGNRVWGVCGNEIKASKLGDFKNWSCYMGLSTDSYTASVGSQGAFTGGANHLGYPLFWKADRSYKVYGSYPAEYQVQETACQGVSPGMWKSLAVVNQVMFYLGADGVYAYDGSTPEKISYALGDNPSFTDVYGCALGHKYVMAAVSQDNQEKTFFYIYDTETGLWHKEYAGTVIMDVESLNSGILYLDYVDDTIYWIGGSAYPVTWVPSEETAPVEWYGETGVLGMGMPDRKYISRVLVRLTLDAGSSIKFFIQYDSKGPWVLMDKIYSTALKTVTIPLRPHRCDHFRLRIEGVGAAEIYSIVKTIEQGSDQ